MINLSDIIIELTPRVTGPAHAVYFGTYELVKDFAGGNVDDGHHPLAAGKQFSLPI
jgi:hypothetical protein